MSAQPKTHHTVAEYLARERSTLEKHEYLRGEAFATGGEAHNLIEMNAGSDWRRKLKGKLCRVCPSGLREKTAASR